MRKLLSMALMLFLGYYLVTQPDSAAGFVHQATAWVSRAAEGMSAFVSSL